MKGKLLLSPLRCALFEGKIRDNDFKDPQGGYESFWVEETSQQPLVGPYLIRMNSLGMKCDDRKANKTVVSVLIWTAFCRTKLCAL